MNFGYEDRRASFSGDLGSVCRIVLDDAAASDLLPERDESGDKTAFGNALVIAGSAGCTGAPFFSATACQRCGAGLVRLAVPSEIHAIEAVKLNEVMVIPVDIDRHADIDERSIAEYLKLASRSDAVLAGPGISVTQNNRLLIRRLIRSSRIPLVLDADALNCLSGDPQALLDAQCDIVITPHEREFTRLFSFDGVPGDDELLGFAARYGAVVVYKSAETRIASPSGVLRVNSGAANSGMAKGGSGDVLAGMVLAFLTQGMEAEEAAALAVRLHSVAGRIARERLTQYVMLPSDVIGCFPEAFKVIMER